MVHAHSDEMMTFIFVWISVIRLKIHMMQCPRWFNGPTSSGQQYKIYSLFNRSCDCHSWELHCSSRGFVLWCVCVVQFYVCLWVALCCRAEQLSVYRQQTVPVFLSFLLSPICQLAFHCPSAPHFSSVVPLWCFCLSLVLSLTGSPLLFLPTSLSAPGLRTCIIPINSHRTGMIYSSLTDSYEICLLRAEQDWSHTQNMKGWDTHTTAAHCSCKSQVFVTFFAVEARFKMSWTALTLIIHHMLVKATHSSWNPVPEMSSDCLEVWTVFLLPNLALNSWTFRNLSTQLMFDLIKQNVESA